MPGSRNETADLTVSSTSRDTIQARRCVSKTRGCVKEEGPRATGISHQVQQVSPGKHIIIISTKTCGVDQKPLLFVIPFAKANGVDCSRRCLYNTKYVQHTGTLCSAPNSEPTVFRPCYVTSGHLFSTKKTAVSNSASHRTRATPTAVTCTTKYETPMTTTIHPFREMCVLH